MWKIILRVIERLPNVMSKLIQVILAVLLLVGIVIVPLSAPGTPAATKPTVVTVDAGHGGIDPGAVVEGVTEKEINLSIALKIKELAKHHPTIDVVLTRETDEYVYLLDRLEIAERNFSVAYLSVQANSFSDPNVVGIQTFVDNSRRSGGLSYKLSHLIQDAAVSLTQARDRGVKKQRLYTRHTSIPSALIEVGFLTSPSERSKLLTDSYQMKIARGILQGLLVYKSQYSSG